MTTDCLLQVAYATLGRYPPAFVALAGGGDTLGELVPGRIEDVAATRLDDPGPGDRHALWAALRLEAERVSAPAPTLNALADLEDGAPVVITGQQPGLLGGPVLTLYKAVTAVALARHLAATWGRPVVPVFWSASYDTDFVEIARAGVAGADGDLRQYALARTLETPGRMVGALPVTAARDLLATLRPLLAPLRGGEAALELAGAIWERGSDWGRGFVSCLTGWLGTHGLVCIDGRLPVLRELGKPVIARYLDQVEAFAGCVEATGRELETRGMERQLEGREVAWSLMLERDGARRSLIAGNTLAVARDTARRVLSGEEPGALWPGVALRPIVVDSVLPTVAQVLGPAEVAYTTQITRAYELLGVIRPALVPRLTMTWVPPGAGALAHDAGLEPERLLLDPQGVVNTVAAAGDPRASAALARLDQQLESAFAGARLELGRTGRGIDELALSIERKVRHQVSRLGEAVASRQRARFRRDTPGLATLPGFVHPGGLLQERVLSSLGLLALAGPELTGTLLELGAEHVGDLRRGAGAHRVIELPGDGA